MNGISLLIWIIGGLLIYIRHIDEKRKIERGDYDEN